MKIQTTRCIGIAIALAVLAACASKGGKMTSDPEAYGENSGAVQAEANVLSPNLAAMHKADDEAMIELGATFHFGFDQVTLSANTRTTLDEQAAYIKTTDTKVRVEGYTDERGTREYNMALGQRRADAVANYLIMNGVPRYNVETVSYGEENPANPGHNERAWAQNRRVELIMMD